MLVKDERIVFFEVLMWFCILLGIFLNMVCMIEVVEISGLIFEIGVWMFKNVFFEFSKFDGFLGDVCLNVNLLLC